MLYRISVAERGLTGIANIFRSRLSRLDDLLRAGTVPLKGPSTTGSICSSYQTTQIITMYLMHVRLSFHGLAWHCCVAIQAGYQQLSAKAFA